MLRNSLLILSLLITLASSAESEYQFRIQLKDKGSVPFSVDKPEQFLSKRAIERRKKQEIAIDKTDLPIAENYISAIEKLGCVVIAKSKWVETISVHTEDSLIVDELKKLSFVSDVTLVWKRAKIKQKTEKDKYRKVKSESDYGYAQEQIAINNGAYLHDKGFKGEGMEIAVIDGGFNNLRAIPLIDNIDIKGIKDFVYRGDNMLAEGSDHGLQVLSCMATNQPGTYVGTAPKAKYWLLRSEDVRSEFPIEEDYWISAIEYADSVGVDLVNSSLGYTLFDEPTKSHLFSELDGNAALISRAAQMATDKGIFVVSSAGNEGNKTWGKISIPGDAIDVLTVGSITRDSLVSYFSSRGPTYDLRIKPDVVAMGHQAACVNKEGYVIATNGTSFSSPIMCGLVACLWQANPNLNSKQLLSVVRRSSNWSDIPDERFGYGIPNMEVAMKLAENETTTISENETTAVESNFIIRSEHAGQLTIETKNRDGRNYNISFISPDGRILIQDSFTHHKQWNLLTDKKRFYIVAITSSETREYRKLLF